MKAFQKVASGRPGGNGLKSQIDFFDLGIEAIGDVYNELLSSRPIQTEDSKIVLSESDTHRKELGSYFTHPELTRLLSSQIRAYIWNKCSSIEEVMAEKFLDNSCGSGHFLRRLIEDISYDILFNSDINRSISPEKCNQEYLKRAIAQHCAFGIDIDKYAVWLTKISLWLQTAEKGKPFVFLDHHIVRDDSLLIQVEEQCLRDSLSKNLKPVLKKLGECDSESRSRVEETRRTWKDIEARIDNAKRNVGNKCARVSYLSLFPEVFLKDDAGFSIIAGNPPWETVKPKHQDFYKQITGASKTPKREEIDAWLEEKKDRKSGFLIYEKNVKRYAQQVRDSGYSFQSGEVYTYAFFVERSIECLRNDGLLCYIVKLGLYGDEGTKKLRELVFKQNTVSKMWIFKSNSMFASPEEEMSAASSKKKSNKSKSIRIFPGIDSKEKFMAIALNKRKTNNYDIYAKDVRYISEINCDFSPWQSYAIPDELDHLNRVTIFRSESEKGIFRKLATVPTLKSGFGLVSGREFDVTNHRPFVTTAVTSIPLFTGEEVRHYHTAPPQKWCSSIEMARSKDSFSRVRIGVNNILPNSRRKIRAAILMPGVITENSVLIVDGFSSERDMMLTLASLNSFINEYYLRPNLSNMNLNNFRLDSVPLPLDFDDWICDQIESCVRNLIAGGNAYSESSEDVKRIEALLCLGYGLDHKEVRSYLLSFEDVTSQYADQVVAYMKGMHILMSASKRSAG